MPFMFVNMKGQQALVGAIILIVSAVVGISIINSIMVDAANAESASQNLINMSSGSATLSPIGLGVVPNSQVLINTTSFTFVEGTHYSFNDDTGVITKLAGTGGDHMNNTKVNATWTYADTSTYSSSLSRTIAQYIVPVGLLAVLGMAVMVAL